MSDRYICDEKIPNHAAKGVEFVGSLKQKKNKHVKLTKSHHLSFLVQKMHFKFEVLSILVEYFLIDSQTDFS